MGTVTSAILLAVVVLVLFLNPWALHMGGRWTPALTWRGVGILHSTTGATYGLYLELQLHTPRGRTRGTSIGPLTNLQGMAKVCTPHGNIYPLTVSGSVKNAWLDADGKPVTLFLRSLKDAQPALDFYLVGSWQGQRLALDDKGSMAMSFLPDGTAKGYLKGSNAPKESANVSLRYAVENEFASVCTDKGKSSF